MSRRIRFISRSKRHVTVAGVLATALIMSTVAVAFFLSYGFGTGRASVGVLDPPTTVVAKAANGSTSLGASPVTITWTAPSSGVTPTGYQVERGTTLLSCTSSPCTDMGVPDGTYTYHVTAIYQSWTSSAVDSAPIQVQNQAATTTTLSSTDNPSVVGEQVTYTATVSTGSGTPTGTVTFMDGASTISCESGSSTTLDGSAKATCKATYTTAANSPHAITATYNGDANYLGSTSSPALSQAVNKASQTISFTSTAPANAKVGGATYTPTATGGASGNSVTFTIDASASSVCSINGSNVVSFQTVGTCVIDANQAGNSDYNAAPQKQQSFTVAKGDQTISFTSTAPTHGKVGTTYTPTATATSGLTMSFSIDSSTSSACSISSGVVTFITVGTCTIDANQGGNGNWNPAPQKQQNVTVDTKGDQTISFTSTAPTAGKVGTTYTPTATATSGLTVSFTIDASSSAVCSISSGVVTFNTLGNCVIDANQAGNTNWNAAPQAQQTANVTQKGDQAISFTSTAPANAKVGGTTYTPTATGGASGNSVTFTIDATASSVCSISAGVVSFQTVGTCVINANQAGNANYNSASQVQQSFSVAKGDQTISFTSSAPTDATTGGVTYIAEATASSGLTVTFSSATTSICTSSGTNGATISFIAAGTCTVNADQAGNANWNAAPTKSQTFTVISPLVFQSVGTAQTWSTKTAENIAYPASTATNDLLLLVVVGAGNIAPSSPNGWNLVSSTNAGNNTDTAVFWKLAATADNGQVTVTPGGSTASGWLVRYARASGYPPNPATATATSQVWSQNGNNMNSVTSLAVTTNANNAVAISVVGEDQTTTALGLGTTNGFTRRGGGSAGSFSFAVGDQFVAPTGTPSGAPVWSSSPTSGHFAGVSTAFH